jgi:hypothetical protein
MAFLLPSIAFVCLSGCRSYATGDKICQLSWVNKLPARRAPKLCLRVIRDHIEPRLLHLHSSGQLQFVGVLLTVGQSQIMIVCYALI